MDMLLLFDLFFAKSWQGIVFAGSSHCVRTDRIRRVRKSFFFILVKWVSCFVRGWVLLELEMGRWWFTRLPLMISFHRRVCTDGSCRCCPKVAPKASASPEQRSRQSDLPRRRPSPDDIYPRFNQMKVNAPLSMKPVKLRGALYNPVKYSKT